jgi:hypothetical protein
MKAQDGLVPLRRMGNKDGAAFGGVYFLGFIGAAVYYIQASSGFGEGLLGFLKALVWPAFLVYEVLRHTAA